MLLLVVVLVILVLVLVLVSERGVGVGVLLLVHDRHDTHVLPQWHQVVVSKDSGIFTSAAACNSAAPHRLWLASVCLIVFVGMFMEIGF